MLERGDPAIAALAGAQHGAVSRGQLVAAGLGRGAIEHRLRRGRLHLAYRGTYFVGHPAAPPAAWDAAALLACGQGSALSHVTAARRWRLVDREPGAIHVTVDARRRPAARPGPHRGGRAGPSLRPHWTRRLGDRDVVVHDGLPLTSPARTLLDLSALASERELRRALDEALLTRITTEGEIVSTLERWPRRPGAGVLQRLVSDAEEPALTRSEAERLLLDVVRAAGLPAPRANVRVARYEVDLLWRDHGVIAEVDGFAFHSSRAAFERDRARDAELQALGYRILRVTWRALRSERERVVAQLAALLARTPR